MAHDAGTRTGALHAKTGRRPGAPKPPAPQRSGARSAKRWPLAVILVVQAGLSLRLIWSDTASPNEALYLWAGHMEWSRWLIGLPLPALPDMLAGAPALYPPLGALADTYGGLTAARLLSLGFITGATVLLHGVTRRMFGRRAADLAAVLFAGLGAAQYLGAVATPEPMAIFLLALATWLATRAAIARTGSALVLLSLSSCSLALADATRYSSLLFDPVVIAVAVLFAGWRRGGRAKVRAAAVMPGVLLVLLAVGLGLAGSTYLHRVAATIASGGTDPALFVLYVSAKWSGLVALLAVVGACVVMVTGGSRSATGLGWTLAAAIFVVPAQQGVNQSFAHLFADLGTGGWFGAIIAGCGVASLPLAASPRKAAAAFQVSVLSAVLIGLPGIPLATSHYGWPDTTPVIPVARRALAATTGPVLADDHGNVLEYYLHGSLQARPVSGTFFFAFNDRATGKHLTGRPAYAAAIKQRYFSVVFLEFWDSVQTDTWIQQDIKNSGGYRLIGTVPYRAAGHHGDAMIWVRA